MDGPVSALVDYMVGSTSSFSLSDNLSEIKPQIGVALGARVEQRLSSVSLAAQSCMPPQLLTVKPSDFSTSGIVCRPGTLTLPELTALAGIPSYASTIASNLGPTLPDRISFTETQLAASLGAESWTRVQDTRRIIREDIEFNNRNVDELIAQNGYASGGGIPWERLPAGARSQAIGRSENVKASNDFRHDFQQGTPVMDEQALRERIQDSSDPDLYETFERVRGGLRSAKMLIPLLLLVPLVLLVLTAVIGGRGVLGKLQFAGSTLAGAGIALIVSGGPAYLLAGRGFSQSRIEDTIAGKGSASPFDTSVSAKMIEVTMNAAGSVFSGIFWNEVVSVIVGVAGILTVVLLRRRATRAVAAAVPPA